jgi:hypothetical protein
VARNPRIFATYDLKQHDADGRLSSHFFLSVFRSKRTPRRLPSLPTTRRISAGSQIEEIRRLPTPPSVLECAERLALRRNKQGEMPRCTLFPSSSGYPIPQ